MKELFMKINDAEKVCGGDDLYYKDEDGNDCFKCPYCGLITHNFLEAWGHSFEHTKP